MRSQSGAGMIHHFLRPETHSYRGVRNLAGELHFLLADGDCGCARKSGLGKEKDGILNRPLRVFFLVPLLVWLGLPRVCLLPKGAWLQEAGQGVIQVVLREPSHGEESQSWRFIATSHKAKPGPEGPGFGICALRQKASR